MNMKMIKDEVYKEIIKMNKLEEEIKEKEKKLKEKEKKFKADNKNMKAYKGKLRCATKGDSYQYYLGTKYLSKKEPNLIEDIANSEYCKDLKKLVREKLIKLEQMRNLVEYDYNRPEELYSSLHPARRCIVTPLLRTKEEYIKQWQDEPYEPWDITDEDVNTQIITARGERVRSKSEKIIADALSRHGIPYKYEYPLELKYGNRIVTKRPDFLVLDTVTLEEKIIEHLGMMGDEDYYQKNMCKIDLYEKNGYLIGKKLIILHETAENPLDTMVMERYIKECLM